MTAALPQPLESSEPLGFEAVIGLQRARARMYRLLAAAFGGRGLVETLEALRQPDAIDYLTAVFGLGVGGDLQVSVSTESVSEVVRDYNRLFVLPSRDRLVLTEQFHLGSYDKRKKTQGPVSIAVAREYARNGFELTKRQMPDHLAVELEFLGVMCESVADAHEAGDRDLAMRREGDLSRFLDKHMAPWGPKLLTSAGERCQTAGLRALISIALGVLEDHQS